MEEQELGWDDLFIYDPTSPTFLINRITRSSKALKDKPAGNCTGKEIKVRYKGKFHRHARIIWELFNGPIPEGMYIGFHDGNSFNLHIENLYLQDARQRGLTGKQPLGISGIRGVWQSRGRWRAAAKVYGNSVHLGTYNTAEDAASGRKAALRFLKEQR